MPGFDGDSCKCSVCGFTIPHTRGFPCFREECPRCGGRMERRKGYAVWKQGSDNQFVSDTSDEKGGPVLSLPPYVIREDCISCGICIDVCVYDAIRFTNGKARVMDERCTLCGACLSICPRNAIREHRKDDQAG